MVTNSRRRLRRPRRQPEEDQGLERPDPSRASRSSRRTRSPRAARAGTSWPPTARSGKLGQDRQAGAGLPAEALQERRLAGQERARLAANVQRRARATSCSRTRTRRSSHARGTEPPVRDPALDDPDREPDRRHRRRATTRRRRTRSSRFLRDAGGAADLRRERLPAGRTRRSRSEFTQEVPGAPGPVHDRRSSGSAAGTKVQKRFFDPQQRHHGADRAAGRRRAPASTVDVARSPLPTGAARAAVEGEGRHGPLPRSSSRRSSSLIVVLPIAALVWESTSERLAGLLGRRSRARRRSPR